MDPELYIIVPARNAETTLEQAVLSTHAQLKSDYRMLIVENGSADATADVAKRLASEYTHIPIRFLTSPPGKIQSLLTGLNEVKAGKRVLFMDSDVIAAHSVFHLLLNQFVTHPELIIAGGHPVSPPRYTLAEETAYLNLSSFFPLSKKVSDDRNGFQMAYLDPQSDIPQEMERQLKPFFHGRIFCVRDKRFLPDNVPKHNIADDVFWSRYIIHKYGGGTIRTRYDARVFYLPRSTEDEFIRYQLRIQQQVKDLLEEFPEFETLEKSFQTLRNWAYIETLPKNVIELFMKEREIYRRGNFHRGKIPWHGDI